ncbi:MAG: hypothetical protein Q4D62_13835 [Planctomycetia bacterium]|nr:hypothetical protein [Planctomycetia bacterium]
MCLWNKILLGLIFIAICACFYFSAITLKTHTVWRGKGKQLQADLEKVQTEIHRYRFGQGMPLDEEFQPSVRMLQKTLARLQASRGNHAWFSCPANPGRDGSANVTVEGANELILPKGTRIYAFEESDDELSARYLGQFFVKSVDAGDVTLDPDPVAVRNPRVLKKIAGSTGNWTLYTIMPADSHEAFRKVDEDELADLLPKESLEEFVKDGQVDEKTGKKWERPLRAYDILFELNMAQDILLNDLIMIEASDALSAADNEKLAQEQVAFQEQLKDALVLQREKYEKEHSAILQFNQQTSQTLSRLEARKQSYLKDIKTKAVDIANRDFQMYKNSPPVDTP